MGQVCLAWQQEIGMPGEVMSSVGANPDLWKLCPPQTAAALPGSLAPLAASPQGSSTTQAGVRVATLARRVDKLWRLVEICLAWKGSLPVGISHRATLYLSDHHRVLLDLVSHETPISV